MQCYGSLTISIDDPHMTKANSIQMGFRANDGLDFVAICRKREHIHSQWIEQNENNK